MKARELNQSTLINNPNLEIYYRFEETSGTSVSDSSGNSNTATASRTNILNNSGGVYGNKALMVGSSSDKITLANPTALNSINKMTVVFWVNLTSFTANLGFISRTTGGASNNQFTIGTANTNGLQIAIESSSTSYFGNYATTGNNVLTAGQWHLIACVFDGTLLGNSNRIKIFVDGEYQNLTYTGTIPASLTSVTQDLIIGQRASSEASSYINASYDDFAIFTDALSIDQIKEIYEGRTVGELWPQGSDGKELAVSSLSADSNLKVYYKLEGNSTDSSSTGNNGTATDITYSAGYGKFGQGASLNGTSSFIDLTSYPFSGSSSFTFGIWFKTVSSGSDQIIFALGDITSGSQGFIVYKRSTNVFGWDLSLSSGTDSTTTVNDGQWHLGVVVNNAGTFQVYLDGNAEGGTSSKSPNIASSSFKRIGATSSSFFDGQIDDVFIFNRALTANEVAELYTKRSLSGLWHLNGNGSDYSGNHYNLTNNNSATYVSGKFGKAVNLVAASSQYLSITDVASPKLEITGSKTWMAWVRPTTLSTQVIMAKDSSNVVQIYYESSGVTHFYVTGTSLTDIVSDAVLTANVWNFVAGVHDAENSLQKIWVNGTVKSSAATGSSSDTNGPFYIGRNASGNYLNGQVDEVAIFNRALSDREIRNYYSWAKGRFSTIL